MASHTHYAQVERLDVVDTGRRPTLVDGREAQDRDGELFRSAVGVDDRAPAWDLAVAVVCMAACLSRRRFQATPGEVHPSADRAREPSRRSSAVSYRRVEIVARNGRRLIVDASLDVAAIARLLDVVERR